MKVAVLGPGCAKCNDLHKRAAEAIRTCGCEAELVKVEQLDQIMSYGVLMTPALVIDGEVKSAGRVPSVEQIAKWLRS